MTDTFTRTELNPIKLAEMLEELENTVELHSISVRYKGETVLEGANKGAVAPRILCKIIQYFHYVMLFCWHGIQERS